MITRNQGMLIKQKHAQFFSGQHTNGEQKPASPPAQTAFVEEAVGQHERQEADGEMLRHDGQPRQEPGPGERRPGILH